MNIHKPLWVGEGGGGKVEFSEDFAQRPDPARPRETEFCISKLNVKHWTRYKDQKLVAAIFSRD